MKKNYNYSVGTSAGVWKCVLVLFLLVAGFSTARAQAPTFTTGSPQSLAVCQGAGATDIKSLLHVSDGDAGQTETWTQAAAPSHGTLTFTGATASSGSSDIAPGGTITYAPAAGYSGTDAFTVQVSDGTATASMVINVTVNALPTVGTTGGGAICSGGIATLYGTGATSYSWTGGITNATYFTPATGMYAYTVTGTDANGCSNTATTTLTVNALPVVGTTGGGTICEGATATISGTGALSYSWLGGISNGVTFTPLTGIHHYTVTGTDAHGCSDTSVATLTVNAVPSSGAGGITTVAGNGSSTFTTDSIATYTGIYPAGVCTDHSGNLYITDYGNNLVRKVTPGGIISIVAGAGIYGYNGDHIAATSAYLAEPASVAIDNEGNLYIADYGNQAIRKVDTAGIITTVAGIPTMAGYTGDGVAATSSRLNNPIHVTVDAAHNLYICDFYSHCIRKVNASGIISTIAGTPASYGFSGDGGPATASHLGYPASTVFDEAGNLYIADQNNFRIRKINSSGTISTFAGDGDNTNYGDGGYATSAGLKTPYGLAAHGGNIYVISPNGNTVRQIDATGHISTIAGDGTAGFAGDGGSALTAEFHFPTDITSDDAGNLYVADQQNSRVRKIGSGASITGTASICTGSTATLAYSGTGGGVWTSTNTAVATVGSSTGIVTGNSAGTATISYTIAGMCGSLYATRVVTVNGTSAGTITGSSAVSTGATIALSESVTGGTWSSSNSHATISSSGVVTGVSAGVATISYSVSGELCGSAVATKTITVNSVSSSTITGTLSLCAGNTTALSDSAAGGTWHSSNTAVATVGAGTGVITAISAGTTTISYTVSGSIVTVVFTVNALPAAISGAATACAGATSTLTDATAGGTWTSSNESIATVDIATGILTGMAAGPVTITYALGTGCSKTKAITVNAMPLPIGGTTAICIGGTATLTNATTGSAAWSSSTPSVATIVGGSGVITGVAAGTTTITYTLTTGCKTTTVVTVAPAPAITGAASVCTSATATLSSATAGGTWSSSAAAATIGSSTGIVTGVSAGTANITYNSPGCRSTRVMTIYAQPNAITGTSSVCVGATGTLSSATTGGAWSSANTAVAGVSSTGVVTGVSTDTTSIIYTMSTGCRRIAVVTVTAAPAITGTGSICAGSSATLSSSITGGTWSSSNTSVATISASTGLLSGVATGTANISYVLSAGCRATAAVTVNNGPAAITGTSAVCTGAAITLSDATPSGTWSSSNTAVATIGSTTGVVSGISTGTAMVTYVTGAGCYRTQAITVGSGAPAIMGNAGICTGASTTFTASITGSSWSSSNTSVVTIGAVSGVASGVAPGIATITFTPYASGSSAGCITTVQVTVNTGVTMASISGTPYVGVGATTNLTDATPGGVWSSSNTANATVSVTGVVTGVSASLPTISYKVTTGACEQLATLVVHVVGSRPGAATAADAEMVRVYPNPTTGNFAVEAPVAGIFAVFTLEGKELMRSDIVAGTNQLSLPHGIAAGIYMCRYIGADGSTIMVRLVYGH